MFRSYEDANPELSSNVANESSSSSGNLGSEFNPSQVTTQTESSSVADTPPHQPKKTTYRKTQTTSGTKYYKVDSLGNVDYNSTAYLEKKETSGIKYYKVDPSGKVDYMTPYDTLPPEGGSHKRYRTTRRSRKYQSRRKSRRHFQRRKITHRHKSRKSRK